MQVFIDSCYVCSSKQNDREVLMSCGCFVYMFSPFGVLQERTIKLAAAGCLCMVHRDFSIALDRNSEWSYKLEAMFSHTILGMLVTRTIQCSNKN